MKLERRVLPAATFSQFRDPNPSPGNGFGNLVVPLSTGNVVVTSPGDDLGGEDAGAVYLFNGSTGELISSLHGAHAHDSDGGINVFTLGTTGNFVVRMTAWDHGSVQDAGAVIFGSGVTGVSGFVSESNALVGSRGFDRIGVNGITVLGNGSYLVRSHNWDNGTAVDAGAVTWGSGTLGVSGVVSALNSVVGGSAADNVGSGGFATLENGNFLIRSPNWDNGTANAAGAITWGSATTGVTGVVGPANSLVGSSSGDNVGSAQLTPLGNGNYVLRTAGWDNGTVLDAGAITWFNQAVGISGVVGPANSLVGASPNDLIGTQGIRVLSNGNYLVLSQAWDNGAAADAGAVTWGNGATGVTGLVSAANSLVGLTANDQIGSNGVTLLGSHAYLVSSPLWDAPGAANAGAVTWASTSTGIAGAISSSNSIVGSTASDEVGQFGAITVLSNGNYVVRAASWDNGAIVNAGAVTWADGAVGIRGTISAANSLIGGSANNEVGLGSVTELPSGNYVVISTSWDNGTATNAGAVTWGSGTAGVVGVVSPANSLLGSTANDRIGNGGITVLPSGNYVIRSPQWDNGSGADAGAVTWGSGTIGVSGVVSAANSLVGSTTSDAVGGLALRVLPNGHFLVQSPDWGLSFSGSPGALTWVNGLTGLAGAVGPAISLVGTAANDRIGESITILPNGNIVSVSANWANGAVTNAGAVTWIDGNFGLTGFVSAFNSLVGARSNDRVGTGGVVVLDSGNYVVVTSTWANGTVPNAGAVTFGSGTSGVSGLVSDSNSLVGSTASDQIGSSGVTKLPTGNYLVRSPGWDRGGIVNAGAVTFGSGTSGVAGAVSSINSLVGTTTSDSVGASVPTVLTNGNYLVPVPAWDAPGVPDAGALAFGSGTVGVSGLVNVPNSLVGSTTNDLVGSAITALPNGNYVVVSPWDDGGLANVGAVTWGNGSTGTKGPISVTNSLIGSSASDLVGNSGITVLSNGNYVVRSSGWDNGASVNAGAVTWASGTSGVSGVLSASNSLIGSSTGDQIGSFGITLLSNGHYLVRSGSWDNGTAVNAGAVTWGSATTGVQGVVSAANSLVGSRGSDNVGDSTIVPVGNGNYLLPVPNWDNGTVTNAGAITWVNGATGTSGVVSAANSLVGTSANDRVGFTGSITVMENGNYLVVIPDWDNAGVLNAGAVTWGSGAAGVQGPISAENSAIGFSESAGSLIVVTYDMANDTFIVGFPFDGLAHVGSRSTGFINMPPSSLTLTAAVNQLDENTVLAAPLPVAILDFDDDIRGTNVWSLSGPDAGKFEFNGLTLQLKAGVVLNYETTTSLTVLVSLNDASVGGDPDTFVVYTLLVSDLDEFDVSPLVDADGGSDAVAENSPTGSTVRITAVAGDNDGSNNAVTYGLTSDAGGRFAIDAVTGIVTVANSSLLNYEAAASHLITVQAASSDGSVSSRSFVIQVLDINDPVTVPTDVDVSVNLVLENAPLGTGVGITAIATDPDPSNTVTYSLSDSAGGRFVIEGSTGVVRVGNGSLLNYEAATSHSITVVALSTDGTTAIQSFVVSVGNVNEPATVSYVSSTTSQLENQSKARFALIQIHDDAIGSEQLSLSGPHAGFFELIGNELYMRAQFSIDYESQTSYSVNIDVDDPALGSGVDFSLPYTLTILDVDEFNVSPVVDSNQAVNVIAENVPDGFVVSGLSPVASDADGTTSAITWSLTNSAGGRFAIDSAAAFITVLNASLLNYESATSHTITVRATSQDGSFSEQSFTIELTDVDEFNVGPITDTNPAINRVPEHSPVGTPVGITAFAQDLDASNDGITYSLWNTRGGRFTIHPTTGVVTVGNSQLLDREGAASWAITVLATSQDGSVSVKEFVVELADVDEFNVGNLGDFDPAPQSVTENAPNGTPVGITVKGFDADATTSAITYSLTQNPGGRFAIDPVTGVVTVANSALLDREAAMGWSITARGTSADGSFSLKGFTIALTDVDEYDIGNLGDFDPAAQSVAENAPNGTLVGLTVKGYDADATNSGISYSLTDNAGGRFAINASTGVVTVANGALLDREAAAFWPITVKAASQDGSFKTKAFSIALSDVDDFDVGPVSDSSAVANTVVENAAAGTLVGITAKATDGDVANNTVTYSLSNNAGGRFQIDPATGVVSVAAGAVLDFEAQTSHPITVQATSSDGSTSQASFTIQLTDVSDTPRVTLSNNTVAENRPSGTVVGTLGTADIAVTTPVYTLVTGTGGADNAQFEISGNQLKTRASFNFESRSSYSIRVQVQGAGGVTLTQVLTILVTNVNEGPTGLTVSPGTIAENNAVGATVGTLQGVDPDPGDSLTYTLVTGSGSTDNVRFTIVGNQLKAAEVFDYERKRSFSIRVRVTDAAGLTYDKVIAISVTNGPG